MFNEKLKERFFNMYKFSNHDNKTFISLFRKSIYRYEYMMTEENSMRHHYIKKKLFIVT